MSDALLHAVGGLNSAAQRIVNATSSIVNASSTPTNAQNNSLQPGADIASNLVNIKIASTDYAASAFVVKVVKHNNDALEHAIDITA